jgi:pilus assembly protein FimV
LSPAVSALCAASTRTATSTTASSTTQYADASADARLVSVHATGPSRVADVSRPDALVDGAADIPVGSVSDRTPTKQLAAKAGAAKAGVTPAAPAVAAAAPTPTPTGEQATSATPVAASAFAGSKASSGGTSLFSRLLGRGDSSMDAVTVVEPASPQPVNSPLPPKPPIRSSDAAQLRGLNAQLPAGR